MLASPLGVEFTRSLNGPAKVNEKAGKSFLAATGSKLVLFLYRPCAVGAFFPRFATMESRICCSLSNGPHEHQHVFFLADGVVSVIQSSILDTSSALFFSSTVSVSALFWVSG